MRTRRAFITLLSGTAAAWPIAARAQPTIPIIGFLNAGSAAQWAHLAIAYRRGLLEGGYVDGQNVAIEYRWADGQYDRLPILVTDLVRHQVAVIAAGGGDPAVLAAKAATATIPILFATGSDPVKSGLVSSFNRPDGNVTGITGFTNLLGSKRLELLRNLVPATLIAVLVNPSNPPALSELADIQAAAQVRGQQLLVLNAASEHDIETAFATLVERQAGALLPGTDSFFTARREQIIALAARHAVPTIYMQREFTDAGGLISYGISWPDIYRQLGIYTGRILRGAKPADLPVTLPTKFELVINLNTAKALSLEIPDKLLALADEVIE
jgi:ABC-type uncharacterized transport system substrate-binding protein